ncbi:hypothetical protein QTO34_013283, partial [Cnephaeus nilssonii]
MGQLALPDVTKSFHLYIYEIRGLDRTIWSQALTRGMSAQKAKLIALTQALRWAKDKSVTIYTDSRYVFATAHLLIRFIPSTLVILAKKIYHSRTDSYLEGTTHCHPDHSYSSQGQRDPNMASSHPAQGSTGKMDNPGPFGSSKDKTSMDSTNTTSFVDILEGQTQGLVSWTSWWQDAIQSSKQRGSTGIAIFTDQTASSGRLGGIYVSNDNDVD